MEVRYSIEELKVIERFLKDAENYEILNRRHWVKNAARVEDEELFLCLANRSQERLAGVRSYLDYVGSAFENTKIFDDGRARVFIKSSCQE